MLTMWGNLSSAGSALGMGTLGKTVIQGFVVGPVGSRSIRRLLVPQSTVCDLCDKASHKVRDCQLMKGTKMFSYADVASGVKKILTKQSTKFVIRARAAEAQMRREEAEKAKSREEPVVEAREDPPSGRKEEQVVEGPSREVSDSTLATVAAGEEVESRVQSWDTTMEMEEEESDMEGKSTTSDRPLTAAQWEKISTEREDSEEEFVYKRSRVEPTVDSLCNTDLTITWDLAVSEAEESEMEEFWRKDKGGGRADCLIVRMTYIALVNVSWFLN